MLKRLWYKTWPKMAVTLCGVALYLAAIGVDQEARHLSSLLIGISAALIAVPVMFVAYDFWQERSNRQLNQEAFGYAGNEMGRIMLRVKGLMSALLYGYFIYFDPDDIQVDDRDFHRHIIRMNETSKIRPDEDGQLYQEKFQLSDYDFGEPDDICAIEKDEVVPILNEVRYLGYQIQDLEIDEAIDELEELLKNYFIMRRLDDQQSAVIVHLLQSLKMLDNILSQREDLFLCADLEVTGFKVQSEGTEHKARNLKMYSLYYTEEDLGQSTQPPQEQHALEGPYVPYEQLLDRKILEDPDEDSLLKVYVVNPDFYIIFGDLITEVLSCVRDWRETREGSVVVDYERGRITPL